MPRMPLDIFTGVLLRCQPPHQFQPTLPCWHLSQVWDVVFNRLAYILGSHHSFITSMAADGDLLATTCSSELRLWSLTRRSCVYRTMLNTAVPVQGECLAVAVSVCGWRVQ